MGAGNAAGRPIRICFVIGKRGGGGAERALTELANLLADMGHEVSVLQKYTVDDEYPLNEKVPVYLVDRRWERLWFLNRRQFIKKVKQIDPDILVPYLEWAEKGSFWAAKLTHRGLISTIRCNPAVFPKRLTGRICRNIRCLLSDRIYVQNEAEARYFPRFIQKRVFVLPNMVSRAFFDVPVRREGGIAHFVSAGRLTRQKNQRLLIGAFSRLVRLYPEKPLRLTIFGEGPMRRELERLIDRLDMRERIVLKGFQPDLYRAYAMADAFVFTSDYEGQPNVLMEAMAAGLPCISTDCPTGPAELIRDGENGLLIPCGTEQRTVQAMARFIEAPFEARRMGQKAREHMEALCDREAIGRVFISQCRRVAGEKTGGFHWISS